jgi:hypothetical protein
MPERSRKDKPEKDPLAVELGRRGGLKGGKARAAKMTAEERSESACKAAALGGQRSAPRGVPKPRRTQTIVKLVGEGWL